MYTLDLSILNLIQDHMKSAFGDAAMQVFSALGDKGMIWIALALILIVIPKTRKAGITVATALVLEVICCNMILKPFVGRLRPCVVDPTVDLLITRPTDFSFPSGHTGASFAATAALFAQKNRLWIPSLIISLLIGFSRLYLYVHYPSDVIAGAFLGTMLGLLASSLVKYIFSIKERGFSYGN